MKKNCVNGVVEVLVCPYKALLGLGIDYDDVDDDDDAYGGG